MTRIGRAGGTKWTPGECGTCHIAVVSGRWPVVRPSIYRALFTFHCSPFTRMWHVPHLRHQVFSRAEKGSRERAFDIRGTRFCHFVARLEGVKNGPILGQNDTYSTHSDRFTDGSAPPTHPRHIRRCSGHLRSHRLRPPRASRKERVSFRACSFLFFLFCGSVFRKPLNKTNGNEQDESPTPHSFTLASEKTYHLSLIPE